MSYEETLDLVERLQNSLAFEQRRVLYLEEENEKLRNITIIQEGSSIRLVIGDEDVKCESCDGKGFDKKFGGGRWDLTCPSCKGSGTLPKTAK